MVHPTVDVNIIDYEHLAARVDDVIETNARCSYSPEEIGAQI